MTKVFIVLAVVLLFVNSAHAQSEQKITGNVVNENDSLLIGNVLLLSKADSSLIKGAYFDFGEFEILTDQKGDLLLKIRSHGYRDSILLVNVDESPINLGAIRMELINNDLDGVTVVAQRTLFETGEIGSLFVNVDKTILGASTSVLEVLSKTPNVIVEDGAITVVGKGEALLYLNGKQITFSRLASIPVPTINKIQIISNPSAKYDAAGRAVINIITKINRSEGFEVSLVQNLILAKHFLSSSAVGISYRKGKWSLRGDYGVTLGKDWNESVFKRSFATPTGDHLSTTDNEENTRLTYVSKYQLGAAYQINKNNFISAEYSGLYNIFDLDIEGNNTVTAPDDEVTTLNVTNDGSTVNLNHTVSLNYNSILDTLGSSLFVAGQYSLFDTKLNDLIYEETSLNGAFNSSAYRRNQGSNLISLFTGQIDYANVFKNSSTLEFGGKFGMVENTSSIRFLSKPNLSDEYEVVPAFSNDFVYNEQIAAAYTQYLGKISKKIDYSIGARAEYTIAKGVSKTLNQTVIDSSYLNIFPNVALTAELSKNWTVGISYSGRISRPQYQDLDPFVWYQDSLTSVQGNPFLIPELTNAYEANINFKKYSLKLGFNDSKNPMKYLFLPGVNGVPSTILQKVNLDRQYSYFTSLSVPISAKFWKSFNTISLTLNQLEDHRPDYLLGTPKPQLYIYTYHRFKVKKWFNIEIIGDFEGPKNDGIYNEKERYTLNVGLSKYMFDGNLSVSFLANDVLQTYRTSRDYQIGDLSVTLDRRLNTNFYRLSIVFYMGKLRNTNYKNKHSGEEESGRVK